jgi:hypothetical protein
MLPSEEIRRGLNYGLSVALWFLVMLTVVTLLTALLFITPI